MKLAVAGGGTGGHLYPGLAVAEEAKASGVADEVVFFGAKRGIESRLVPAAGFELVADDVEGVVGRSPLAAARSALNIAATAWRVRRELRGRSIDVVVGVGGYASAPAVAAARSAGIPVVLLEQNREPGLANRVLSRLASAVCVSFEDTASLFPPGLARWTGNPLRRGFDDAPPLAERDTLLVFGGSAGARSVNRALLAAASELRGSADLPRIHHQTGFAFVDEVRAGYEAAGVEAEVVAYIDDMPSAYARTLLAVCRSGATSIAELVASGTPSVLIPYPLAAADHQTGNARTLERAGAAVVVVDDDECAKGITAALVRLLGDRAALGSMAEAARSLARPGAARRVVEVAEEFARRR